MSHEGDAIRKLYIKNGIITPSGHDPDWEPARPGRAARKVAERKAKFVVPIPRPTKEEICLNRNPIHS